jgi:hypothetical protein
MKVSFNLQTTEEYIRWGVIAAFFLWNVLEGAIFEHEYPRVMVALYPYAIWRFLLAGLLILAMSWCPCVGVMVAFFLFFYVMDMEVTLGKWTPETKN